MSEAYYVETGYVEPGYFISEPAPGFMTKVERITILKGYNRNQILREIDSDLVERILERELIYRPINRTVVDKIITVV